MNNPYIPLHHKYRPKEFDDLIGQEIIATTLKQALQKNRIAPAYLFSGPRGTGKTSSARILAKSLNCLKTNKPTISPCGVCEICKSIGNSSAMDVIEIDAASNTGVDNIRDIIEKSRFAPVQTRWKVYVIDECHMLSTAAFNALLKTLEEPPLKSVFILATTDPQKLLPTIISRCQRFDFRRIPRDLLQSNLETIAKKERIDIEIDALTLIADRAQGGLRDAQRILDQLSLLPQPIKLKSVWDLLGEVPEEDLISLASSLIQEDPLLTIKNCRYLLDNGNEAILILQGITAIIRDLIIIKSIPNDIDLYSVSNSLKEKLINISNHIDTKKLLYWQSHLKGSEYQIRQSYQPRLWLEVILLGLLHQKSSEPSVQNTNVIKKPLSKEIENKEVLKNAISLENEHIAKKEQQQTTTTTNENEVFEEDLNEIWNRTIAQIELPSTRMLLSQQSQLIRITNNQVEITVSANWLSMIQSRKNIIEQAILQSFGEAKQVIINSRINSQIKMDTNSTNAEIPLPEKRNAENIKRYSTQSGIQSSTRNKEITKNMKEELNQDSSKINESAQKFADFFNGEVLDN